MNRRQFTHGTLALGLGAVVGLTARDARSALLGQPLFKPPKPPKLLLGATPKLTWTPRELRAVQTPYLVIPKIGTVYQPDDPIWNNWLGAAWQDPAYFHPHGFWFDPPAKGQSVRVCVPVANLGNSTSFHTVVEIYEGPPATTSLKLSDCSLCDRIGPLTVHPGRIKGVDGKFVRNRDHGCGVAICYDPFFDPRSAIGTVGRYSSERKNLGGCIGLRSLDY